MPLFNHTRFIAISDVVWVFLVLVLLVSNIFFGVGFFMLQRETNSLQSQVQAKEIDVKILDFAKLFIAKVLKAEQEVDFDTRLEIETAVRTLGDQDILVSWQAFTESRTEAEAQNAVTNLLEILVNKIRVE